MFRAGKRCETRIALRQPRTNKLGKTTGATFKTLVKNVVNIYSDV